MAAGRYTKVKRKPKVNKNEEAWKAPNMYSDRRRDVVVAAINSVDAVAREMEMKWGIGKLEELASPKLAVQFERARQNFSEAANGDDEQYLVQKAENLVKGWKALEAQALKNGFSPDDAQVWYAVAPDDVGEYTFAVVRYASDAAAVDREKYPRVYTLDEVARIIYNFETSMVRKAKQVFPNAEITKIGNNDKKEPLNDPIPF